MYKTTTQTSQILLNFHLFGLESWKYVQKIGILVITPPPIYCDRESTQENPYFPQTFPPAEMTQVKNFDPCGNATQLNREIFY